MLSKTVPGDSRTEPERSPQNMAGTRAAARRVINKAKERRVFISF
jgi:hypothetical protein